MYSSELSCDYFVFNISSNCLFQSLAICAAPPVNHLFPIAHGKKRSFAALAADRIKSSALNEAYQRAVNLQRALGDCAALTAAQANSPACAVDVSALNSIKAELENRLQSARGDVAGEMAVLTSTMIKMKEDLLGTAQACITELTSELNTLKIRPTGRRRLNAPPRRRITTRQSCTWWSLPAEGFLIAWFWGAAAQTQCRGSRRPQGSGLLDDKNRFTQVTEQQAQTATVFNIQYGECFRLCRKLPKRSLSKPA